MGLLFVVIATGIGPGALGQTLDGGFSAFPQTDCDRDFSNACGDDLTRSCSTPASDSALLTGFRVQCPEGFQGQYTSNRHYVQTCGEGNNPASWAGGYYDLVEAQAECLPLNTSPDAPPPQTVCADNASLQTDGTCACNTGHADLDGDASVCMPCPANSTVSADGGTCVCDAGYEYDDPDDPQSCLEECPSGASRDDAGICVCSDGYVERGDICERRASCTAIQEYDGGTNTCTSYYAGICPRGLGPFEETMGTIRHDDVGAYYVAGNNTQVRLDKEKHGFYAQSDALGLFTLYEYVRSEFQSIIVVPGIHRVEFAGGDSGFNCLPAVDKSEYNRIRSAVIEPRRLWTTYHMYLKSCQHWAAHVVKGGPVPLPQFPQSLGREVN